MCERVKERDCEGAFFFFPFARTIQVVKFEISYFEISDFYFFYFFLFNGIFLNMPKNILGIFYGTFRIFVYEGNHPLNGFRTCKEFFFKEDL